jgi:hypothetical protein
VILENLKARFGFVAVFEDGTAVFILLEEG